MEKGRHQEDLQGVRGAVCISKLAAHGIQLVQEDDARCTCTSLDSAIFIWHESNIASDAILLTASSGMLRAKKN